MIKTFKFHSRPEAEAFAKAQVPRRFVDGPYIDDRLDATYYVFCPAEREETPCTK